jgi:hypothetical protein
MIFVLAIACFCGAIAAVQAASSVSPIESNAFYCCAYANNATACELGGCQRGNVTAFHIVDDCSHCSSNSSSKSSFNATCTYCGNGAACANTTSDAFECAPPNASFPILYSFVSASTQLTRPLCCWFAENATALAVVASADSCQSARQPAPLVAFAEHLFDFDCPPRPPCESDCSGHGRCAVSQCVCDRSFFGDNCSVRCDSRTCVLGHCYAMRGSDQLCHCHPNVVGERCDRCAAGFAGADCMSTIMPATTSSSSSGTSVQTSSSESANTDVPTVTTGRTSVLPGNDSSHSAPSTVGTTEMVRDRSRTAATLDTFSIIALSIGGAVMMTLLICTFRRCILWMREQRGGRSGGAFMLLQQEHDDPDEFYQQR